MTEITDIKTLRAYYNFWRKILEDPATENIVEAKYNTAHYKKRLAAARANEEKEKCKPIRK